MKKINLSKIFKFKFGGKSIIEHKNGTTNRDWGIIILINTLIIISIVAFSGYVFLKVQSGDFFRVKPEEGGRNGVTVDIELLDETLGIYRSKSEKFEEYKVTSPNIPQIN